VVDEDPGYTRLLVKALVRAGVPEKQIRALRNGDQAAAALQDPKAPWTPSLLLCDVGETGLKFLEWVRGYPPLRGLSVFMLSSGEDPRQVCRAFELKATSFYVKPTDVPEINVVVDGILAFWSRRMIAHRE
jgi:DNA-binding NtrC family response regulator